MPDSNKTLDSGIVTKAVSLTGVTGIKATVVATVSSSGGPSNDRSQVDIFEVQAYRSNLYKRVSFHLAKKLLGKMKDYNASIETPGLTAGTWTSPAMQLNPESLNSLWWNESISGTSDMLFYIRTGSTKTVCESATWYPVGGFSNPNAQDLSSITPDSWVQYKIEFTCTDTTISNPKVYSANGFLVKVTYSKGATQAETAVELIYDIGFRNFDLPDVDKIFQKLALVFEGTEGSFQVYWETENSSGNFTISLGSFPARWSAYFPSSAMGKELRLKIYKNDSYAFKLKEIQGYYNPQPLII